MKFPLEDPRLVGIAPTRVPWGWSYKGPTDMGAPFVWMGVFSRGLVQVAVSLQEGPPLYMVSAKLADTMRSVEGESMRRIAVQFFADGVAFDQHGHIALRFL